MSERIVVKVGGSLFDWEPLRSRLRNWLATLSSPQILLVPGGGSTADVIREFDVRHRLGEERAHWLALRAMTLNAHFLAELLPDAVVRGSVLELRQTWGEHRFVVLDAYSFVVADERRQAERALPHTWQATSDSVAARVARCVEAGRLVLLKSESMSASTWQEASGVGYVDPVFSRLVMTAPFTTEVINLREWEV